MLRDSSGRSADTSGEHGGAREACGEPGFAAFDFSLCHYVGSRNAAAGGRRRHCGISAAVGESEEQRKPERFSGHRKAEGYMVPRLQIPAPRILAGGSPPSLLSARRILIRGCICPLARTLPTDQDLEVLLMPCPAHSSACIRFFLSRTLLTL